jgi:hypothetical protein
MIELGERIWEIDFGVHQRFIQPVFDKRANQKVTALSFDDESGELTTGDGGMRFLLITNSHSSLFYNWIRFEISSVFEDIITF